MLRTIDRNNYLLTFFLSVSCVLAIVLIIVFPDFIFQASLNGLEVWWKIVFPALLPFLMLTELLAGFGLFHSFGKLLQPAMRFLFRLPGEAGWAVACGITAGFPTGAYATAELRRRGVLTVREGERLLALSHFCSPILLMHIVAVGFFQDRSLGWMLIIIHIVSLLVTGVLLRGTQHIRPPAPRDTSEHSQVKSTIEISEIERDPVVSGPDEPHAGFGKRLGDAVMSSIQKLMNIGGIMIVFAVIIELTRLILSKLSLPELLVSIGFSEKAFQTALSAMFEIHLGAFQFSETIIFPQLIHVALLSSLFAWSGLSAHLQAQSIARRAGLRYRSFMYARMLHAVTAIVTTALLWKPLHILFPRTVASFTPSGDLLASGLGTFWLSSWFTLLIMFLMTAIGLSLLSFICHLLFKGKYNR